MQYTKSNSMPKQLRKMKSELCL